MTRVMIHDKNLLYYIWAEAMEIAYHIRNRVKVRPGTKATHYEL